MVALGSDGALFIEDLFFFVLRVRVVCAALLVVVLCVEFGLVVNDFFFFADERCVACMTVLVVVPGIEVELTVDDTPSLDGGGVVGCMAVLGLVPRAEIGLVLDDASSFDGKGFDSFTAFSLVFRSSAFFGPLFMDCGGFWPVSLSCSVKTFFGLFIFLAEAFCVMSLAIFDAVSAQPKSKEMDSPTLMI